MHQSDQENMCDPMVLEDPTIWITGQSVCVDGAYRRFGTHQVESQTLLPSLAEEELARDCVAETMIASCSTHLIATLVHDSDDELGDQVAEAIEHYKESGMDSVRSSNVERRTCVKRVEWVTAVNLRVSSNTTRTAQRPEKSCNTSKMVI